MPSRGEPDPMFSPFRSPALRARRPGPAPRRIEPPEPGAVPAQALAGASSERAADTTPAGRGMVSPTADVGDGTVGL